MSTGTRPGPGGPGVPGVPPSRSFRPTRSSTTAAAATSTSTSTSTPTTTLRSRPTSRPPSDANASSSSAAALRQISASTSRPGSAASARHSTSTNGAPASNRTTMVTGLKRRTRSTSDDTDQQASASKRPALGLTTTAFSAHISQTSLNRQLIAAQTQVTELQNQLLERQRKIDALEADLRLVGTREEEEREARRVSEEELSLKTKEYETEVSRLKRRLAELEADHEDLDDAYSNLSHSSQSKIAALSVEVTTRDERIELLETQLREAETKAREEEIRAKALEELLEQISEDDVEDEEDGQLTAAAAVDSKPEIEGPESVVSDAPSTKADDEAEVDELDADGDVDADADADGEHDEDQLIHDAGASDRDATPTGDRDKDIEISNSPGEANTFYEGGHQPQPEIESEAYPDPGAPPPYTVSSPTSSPTSHADSASVARRERSRSTSTLSVTSSRAGSASNEGSIASSRAMSLTLDGAPISSVSHQQQQRNSIPLRSPISTSTPSPNSHLDPLLSHIRRRLSLVTPHHSIPRRSSLSINPRIKEKEKKEKDTSIIRAELARTTSHLTTLEASNARLSAELARVRPRAEGAEVLREEKRQLERRLEGVEGLRVRVVELEREVAQFALMKEGGEGKGGGVGGGRDENENDFLGVGGGTPVSISKQLTTLRKTHATLLDEHGLLKASLRTAQLELTSTKEDFQAAQAARGRLENEVEQLRGTLVRKEKERVLVERDVVFLRSLVSSYKDEEEVFSVEDAPEVMGKEKEMLERRVGQLESLLGEYKEAIGKLEEEVDRLQRSGGGGANRTREEWEELTHRASALEEAYKTSQSTLSSSTTRIETLEQRLFELGGEIGGGRYVPPGVRVLELRENPAREWKDTREVVLEGLRRENEALLLERLRDVDVEGRAAAAAAVVVVAPLDESSSSKKNETTPTQSQSVPLESYTSLKASHDSLSSLLSQKEKRLLRLQQVYAAKSAEFRAAIESVLGLKAAFYPNGQVRLTSVYDLGAAFVFQPSSTKDKDKDEEEGSDSSGFNSDEKENKDGGGGAKMQLIATGDGGPQELEGLMNTWIRDEMCIPCFMASVTLECYDKWKSERRRG